MATSIRSNIASLKAANQLNKNNSGLKDSLSNISSGLRINDSGDDIGGMSVSFTMKSDSASMRQAMRNTNDGISMLQTAESGLSDIYNILTRLREIATQLGNSTYTSQTRQDADAEYTNLITEISHISDRANFNRVDLLNANDTINFHVGIQSSDDHKIAVDLGRIAATLGALNITAKFQSLDDGSGTYATYDADTITTLTTALNKVNVSRAYLGALNNRMENALDQANVALENMEGASSQIMDTDYATESSEMTRRQILQEAGQASLGQAANIPQSLLQLLS